MSTAVDIPETTTPGPPPEVTVALPELVDAVRGLRRAVDIRQRRMVGDDEVVVEMGPAGTILSARTPTRALSIELSATPARGTRRAAVPWRVLSEALKLLTGGTPKRTWSRWETRLGWAPHSLIVSAAGREHHVPAEAPRNTHPAPRLDDAQLRLRVDRHQLTATLERLEVSRGRDNTIPALTAFWMQPARDGHGTLELATTDRFRLAVARLDADPLDTGKAWRALGEHEGWCLPADLLPLAKTLPAGPVDLQLPDPGASHTFAWLRGGTVTAALPLLGVVYPRYRNLLEVEAAASVSVDRDALAAALGRALEHAESQREDPGRSERERRFVDLRIDTGRLSVVMDDHTVAALAAQVTGTSLIRRFNLDYLRQAVATIPAGGRLTARLNGGRVAQHTISLTAEPPHGCRAYQHLLMCVGRPARLDQRSRLP